MRFGVIDLGISNIGNALRAFSRCGFQVRTISSYKDWKEGEGILFPGVGSYPRAVAILKERGLWEPLLSHLREGKPYFGICLGFQLIFDEGEEWGRTEGLKVFPGKVERLPEKKGKKRFPVPHIGWNSVAGRGNLDLFVPADGNYFYFVHSYAPSVGEGYDEWLVTEYSVDFLSGARKGLVAGVQFHPERSGILGEQFLLSVLRFYQKG
jgi:glutamine amidotransferase